MIRFDMLKAYEFESHSCYNLFYFSSLQNDTNSCMLTTMRKIYKRAIQGNKLFRGCIVRYSEFLAVSMVMFNLFGFLRNFLRL